MPERFRWAFKKSLAHWLKAVMRRSALALGHKQTHGII
jgi:hypothetical protein